MAPLQLLFPFLAPLLLESVRAQTTRLPPITQSDKIGYTAEGISWGTANCPASSTWYQTSTWGRCCPVSVTTPCAIWTACASTSVIFLGNGQQSATCSGNDPVCRTALVAQNENDRTPFVYIGCGKKNWTAFRTAPIAVVESLTLLDSSTRSQSTSTLFTATSTGTTNTASNTASFTAPAASQSAVPPGTTDGGSASQAWIAGAVIGPIALITIAGLLVYIWRLKRGKKEDPSAQPMMTQGPHTPIPQAQQPYYPPNAQYTQYPSQPYNPQADQYGAPPPQYYNPHAVQKPYQDQYPHMSGAPVELSAASQAVEAPANSIDPTKVQPK